MKNAVFEKLTQIQNRLAYTKDGSLNTHIGLQHSPGMKYKKGKNSKQDRHANLICYNCGKKGHVKYNCPNNEQDTAKEKKDGSTRDQSPSHLEQMKKQLKLLVSQIEEVERSQHKEDAATDGGHQNRVTNDVTSNRISWLGNSGSLNVFKRFNCCHGTDKRDDEESDSPTVRYSINYDAEVDDGDLVTVQEIHKGSLKIVKELRAPRLTKLARNEGRVMKVNTKIKVGATLVGEEDSGATDRNTYDSNLLTNCRPCSVSYRTGNTGILKG